EITGKRLGLLGFGRIAREVAWRGTALGMEIAAFDPFVPAQDAAWQNAQRLDLDALLAQSDAVSLHVPLTDQTRHLIDRHAIANMQPGAVLVNAARGGTLDEQALADALREGHLAGAALDVFETEPLTRAAADRFKGLHNLILTPHIAGVTSESNQRVSAITADNVRRVLMQAS
ncbi:MAG: 3-phosphoglycerate dehydrogenase, partial [Gammaproteobacteria bacterium]|nr:3-phosphoglycerate dehydrogenase [Gammaproteobacteria bacterium]